MRSLDNHDGKALNVYKKIKAKMMLICMLWFMDFKLSLLYYSPNPNYQEIL